MFSTKLRQMVRLNLSSSSPSPNRATTSIHGFSSTTSTTTCKPEVKAEESSTKIEIKKVDDGHVFSPELIDHLERTSLVRFGSEKAVETLAEAVQFADTLFQVDTTRVQPLVSVLENEPLRLRPDVPVESDRSKILSNALLVEEDYFVAPPGNIPLEKKSIK